MRLALLGVLVACSLRADTYFLTVSGLGGEQEYEQRFSGWAKDLDKLLRAEPGGKVELLQGKDATKVNIEAKLKAFATQAKQDDEVVVLLDGGVVDACPSRIVTHPCSGVYLIALSTRLMSACRNTVRSQRHRG